MPRNDPPGPHDPPGPSDPPTDAEEFNERLARLLSAAAANGVDVRGGWVCRYEGAGHPGYEVTVVELAPAPGRGSE